MLEDLADGSATDVSIGLRRRGEIGGGGSWDSFFLDPMVLVEIVDLDWSGLNPMRLASSEIAAFHSKSRVQAVLPELPW